MSRLEQAAKFFQSCSNKDLSAHRKKVNTINWSCTGERLASGCEDSKVKLWNVGARGSVVAEADLVGHTSAVVQLAWHPSNPHLLCTASSDKTMRVWDSRSATSVRKIDTRGQNINLAWSPDGACVAVANKDDLLTFIDTKTWKATNIEQFKDQVYEFSWDPSGKFVFLSTGHGTVMVLQFPSLQKVCSLKAHTGSVITLQFDPTGRYLGTGGQDAFACLFDLRDMVCVQTLAHLDTPPRSLSFSHDGQFIASAAGDRRIDISDVRTGQHVHYIDCRDFMNSVAWSPTALLLAYAGDYMDSRTNMRVISVFGFPR